MKKQICVVAAHPDDEVLGCGGVLARMASEGHKIHVLILADGESSRSGYPGYDPVDSEKISTRRDAAKAACAMLGCSSVEFLTLPDNRLDGIQILDIIKPIEQFIECHKPETVFTHHAGDLNIDHCIVHDAVITSCRPQAGNPVKELLFFEIPSSTEWRPPSSGEPFNPNVFIDISLFWERKIRALAAYERELRDFPHPRSLKAIEALAHWRGATAGVMAAEAFILGRRII